MFMTYCPKGEAVLADAACCATAFLSQNVPLFRTRHKHNPFAAPQIGAPESNPPIDRPV
jgi:hypothetical protein